MRSWNGYRTGAACLLSGLVLFAAAAMLHPPEFDPGDPGPALLAGPGAEWRLVHWGLLAGTVLMAIGLAAFHHGLSRRGLEPRAAEGAPGSGAMAPIALSLPAAGVAAVSSFVLWVLLFAVEAAGWPVLAEHAGMASVHVATRALWRAILATGYVAGVLFAGAVALWAHAAAGVGALRKWANVCGMLGGILTMLMTPVAWVLPRYALALLLPCLGLIGLWMLMVVRELWDGMNA